MSSPRDPSLSSPLPPQVRTALQEVLTGFDAYARIRWARDGILTAVAFSPRDEQRAFADLQQAVSRLRTFAA